MARPSAREERPIHWVGATKKDLLAFPTEVIDDFGYALSVVQHGGFPPCAKAWKGEGPGIFELVEEYRGDAFRAVYTVRFEKAILCPALLSEEVALWCAYGQTGCPADSRTSESGTGRL